MGAIVITGTSRGLGFAIAGELWLAGRDVWGLDSVLLDVPWHQVHCDVRDKRDVIHALTFLPQEIDALVNNAGINGIDYLENVKDDDWDRIMNTNARSIFNTSQVFLPRLASSKGVIINITSNAAHVPMTASLVYGASKAAADIMTRQLARELTPRWGISVVGIAPNRMATDMSGFIDQSVVRVRGWTLEETRAYQKKSLLTGEETDPNCVAEYIAWLLQKRSRTYYMTGSVVQYGV